MDHFTPAKKDMRRYGLEFEFSGLPIDEAADLIGQAIDGNVLKNHKTHFTIHHESAGDFTIELDVELAQKISQRAKEQSLAKPDGVTFDTVADMFLPEMLSQVAPTELVTPPLNEAQFPLIEQSLTALRQAGAMGTGQSVFYAFGYHINPEVLDISAPHILNVLRAYVCLYDWLTQEMRMDISRKISGYAAPYEKPYRAFILDPSYTPDLLQLMDDYVQFNPSRNYALDLLPLFRHINETHLKSLIDLRLIKARPTWHFRMPNCEIDNPAWDFKTAIKVWKKIELLAMDTQALEDIMQAYRKRKPEILSGIDPVYIEYSQSILNRLADRASDDE